MEFLQELLQLNESGQDAKVREIINKIIKVTPASYGAAYAFFVGGDAPGLKAFAEKIVADGFNDGYTQYKENKAWFEKHGVSKTDFNVLVKASM